VLADGGAGKIAGLLALCWPITFGTRALRAAAQRWAPGKSPPPPAPFRPGTAQDAAYWGSWALTHWAVLAASGALCTLAGLYPFSHSDPALMLAFYWLLAAALVAFAYAAGALFGAARVAGTASQLLYALSMIPGWVGPGGGAGCGRVCCGLRPLPHSAEGRSSRRRQRSRRLQGSRKERLP
jgi:hypothetical protein